MKKKLQEYALVAEIASAIAVVISLIFVGLQIHQSSEETALNTNAIQVSAYQALAGDVMAINLSVSGDPQLAELVSRIREGGTFNDLSEKLQYDNFLSAIFEHGDMAYYQYEKGIIEEERLRNTVGIVTNQFEVDYVREQWNEVFKFRLDPDFANYLEDIMAEE